mgnify:CR=1 FL=1
MCSDRQLKIGDVYMMHFTGSGSEQHGLRPGVVFSNNTGNRFSPNIIALPMTSSIKKRSQPTHVVIKRDGTGLAKDSMVLCENPERMSKDKIGNYITTLSIDYVRQIAIAAVLATSAISFIEPDSLITIWEEAKMLNSKGAQDVQ